MNISSLVLSIHVLSSMALFSAFALEGNVFLRIRAARSAEELQEHVVSFERLRWIGIPAFLGLLGGGGYLAFKSGSDQSSILASLVATLLLMVVGGTVTGIRMARLRKLAAASRNAQGFGIMSSAARGKALVWSYGFRVGLTVGIVFLMTIRPHLVVSGVVLAGTALNGMFIATASYGRNE